MNEKSNPERIIAPMSEIVPLIVQTLEDGGQFRLITAGTSMKPLLRNRRDTVVLAKAQNVSRFDIVLYRRKNGQYVLHRIVRCEDDGSFTLCGDNQLIYEHGINREDIIASVCEIEKNGKTIDFFSPKYRLYVFFWCRCRAVRFFALKTRALCLKIKNFPHKGE